MALLEIPVSILDFGVFIAHTPALREQTCGKIAENAVDKTSAGEQPHAHARVWVLRMLDGKKVWDGFADENGNWQAEGLNPGREYVVVGIDQKRVFKATAAGPLKPGVEGA